MTDEQYYVNQWLSRMWDKNGEIEQLVIKRDKLVGTISKYESTGIHGGSDTNPTETKNLEYCELCNRIEKLQNEVSFENARTLQVINLVGDSKLRGMMIGHYLNSFSWRTVGKMFFYGKSRAYEYRTMCLDAVAPFVPKEAFATDNKFQSLKEWTQSDN